MHKTEAWLFNVRWMRRALQETGKDASGMVGKLGSRYMEWRMGGWVQESEKTFQDL